MKKTRRHQKKNPGPHSSNTSQIYRIVFEDSDLMIIEKLQGFQSQRSDRNPDHEGLDEFVSRTSGQKIFPVHRLDREVLGLMVYAKTKTAAEALTALFRERDIEKVYWARVVGRVAHEQVDLVHYLKKNEKTNHTTVFIRPTEGAKKAELTYRLIQQHEREAELLIRLKTGRSHQIRAQLAKVGHPILGDRRYGKGEGVIQLKSIFLRFRHPRSSEWKEFSLWQDRGALEKLL